jgi:hypothetical protein
MNERLKADLKTFGIDVELVPIEMKDAFALVTVHDLNLRVLSKKVRNFVQPQAWTVDLYNLYMENNA